MCPASLVRKVHTRRLGLRHARFVPPASLVPGRASQIIKFPARRDSLLSLVNLFAPRAQQAFTVTTQEKIRGNRVPWEVFRLKGKAFVPCVALVTFVSR